MARLRSALSVLALAFAGSTFAPSAAAGEAGVPAPDIPPPIAWQEPSPIGRMFLQLPFEAPDVVAARRLELGLRLLYTNSILAERTGALAVDVHVETAQPTIFARYGLLPGLEAQLAVPIVVDHGGFLDRPIEVVEGWFHALNPSRVGRPRNQARFHLTTLDGRGISRDGAAAGLGEVWAGLKLALLEGGGGRRKLAVRAALKLPTGRLPFGSESVDGGVSLFASQAWSSTAVRLQLDVVAPAGDLDRPRLNTRVHGDAYLGVTQRLGRRVALHVQGSYHLSPLGGNGMNSIDGATAYVLLGTTVALSPSLAFHAAVAENVFSPGRGADISFLFGLSGALQTTSAASESAAAPGS